MSPLVLVLMRCNVEIAVHGFGASDELCFGAFGARRRPWLSWVWCGFQQKMCHSVTQCACSVPAVQSNLQRMGGL
jgi:hypothetical protein